MRRGSIQISALAPASSSGADPKIKLPTLLRFKVEFSLLLQFRETIYSTVTAMVTPCPWPVDLSRTFVKVVTILNPTNRQVLIDSLELVGSSTMRWCQ